MRSASARRTPSWVPFGSAIVSGLLFALAFPPFEWVILLPFALVPWIIALAREESRGRALFSGFLFALFYWCASIPWIVYVVTHYGGQSGPMGVLCLVLLAVILSQWPAAVAWGTVSCAVPGSKWRWLAFPVLWTAAEHARSSIYGGFPWNLTGHALYRHPVWLQTASIWGVYGVGFCVAAIASLLAFGAASRRLGPFGAAALAAFSLGAAGLLRMSAPGPAGVPLAVALLQPNLTEEDRQRDRSGSYASVIGQAREAARARPQLLLIPESALPAYWDRSATLRRDLSEISDGQGVGILFNDVEETADGRYYNVARLRMPGGASVAPYRKVHLVPFGEYVPLPKLFFFVRQISAEIGAFSAAPSPDLLRSGPLRIGVGICYEIIYPSLVRREAASGANLLATISNDSWYGRAGAQAQHFAGATLRAVETNRYLLRAAITGISGIVDEKGRILEELGADRAGIVRGKVRLLRADTAWTRWGFWFPRFVDLVAAAVLVFGLIRWTRRRSRRPPPVTDLR